MRPPQPSAHPTPILTFPHHQHSSSSNPPSSLLSISSSRTSATANFTPAPHRMCPPPRLPPGLPSPGQAAAAPRWGPPLGHPTGRGNPKLARVPGTSRSRSRRPPERLAPGRTAGTHVRMFTRTGVCRLAHPGARAQPFLRPLRGSGPLAKAAAGSQCLDPAGGGSSRAPRRSWRVEGVLARAGCGHAAACRRAARGRGGRRLGWGPPESLRPHTLPLPAPDREPGRQPEAGDGPEWAAEPGAGGACGARARASVQGGRRAERPLFPPAGPQEFTGSTLRGTAPLGRAGTKRRPRRARRRRRPSRRT